MSVAEKIDTEAGRDFMAEREVVGDNRDLLVVQILRGIFAEWMMGLRRCADSARAIPALTTLWSAPFASSTRSFVISRSGTFASSVARLMR